MTETVSDERLTAYEAQVLIGTSISGCNMSPDRVFDLPAAWARLHALGLVDRLDGLAMPTEKGEAAIAAMLRTPPQNTDGEAVADERLKLAIDRLGGLEEIHASTYPEFFDDAEILASAASALSAMKAERDALLADGADKAQAWDAIAEKNATIAALQAERDALRKALEPFAATAEVDIGETETDEDIFQQATHNRAPQITVGDFRRARSTLQGDAK